MFGFLCSPLALFKTCFPTQMGLIYSLSLLALRMLGFLGSFGPCAATHEKISSRMKVLLSAKMIIFHFPI